MEISVFSNWDITCMVMDKPPRDRIEEDSMALYSGDILSSDKSFSPIVTSNSDFIIMVR